MIGSVRGGTQVYRSSVRLATPRRGCRFRFRQCCVPVALLLLEIWEVVRSERRCIEIYGHGFRRLALQHRLLFLVLHTPLELLLQLLKVGNLFWVYGGSAQVDWFCMCRLALGVCLGLRLAHSRVPLRVQLGETRHALGMKRRSLVLDYVFRTNFGAPFVRRGVLFTSSTLCTRGCGRGARARHFAAMNRLLLMSRHTAHEMMAWLPRPRAVL